MWQKVEAEDGAKLLLTVLKAHANNVRLRCGLLGTVGPGPHPRSESGRTGAITGYTARELVGLFLFTAAEVAAALELRRIGADIVNALEQKREADRRALEQKTPADNRAEWWRRAQWALDSSLSDDPDRA